MEPGKIKDLDEDSELSVAERANQLNRLKNPAAIPNVDVTPWGAAGKVMETWDGEVANRARAAALASLKLQNPVDAAIDNKPTPGKEVFKGFRELVSPETPYQSKETKATMAGINNKLDSVGGIAADMAIDPMNAIPFGKLGGLIAGAGAVRGGVKSVAAAEDAGKAAQAITHDLIPGADFHKALDFARKQDPRVQDFTHLYEPEEYAKMKTFLAPDGKSGFAVKDDGDIVSAFNTDRGGGRLQSIMDTAKASGGYKLDAFAGKEGEKGLPELYSKHGFVEYKREPNWEAGGPDVVYMHLPQAPGNLEDLAETIRQQTARTADEKGYWHPTTQRLQEKFNRLQDLLRTKKK